MLKKERRVTSKLFQETLKKGPSFDSENIYLKRMESTGPTRLTFSVPKTVEKGVVKRNYLKRKGLSILEKHTKSLKKGFVLVFFLKKTKTFPTEEEFVNLLEKAKIVENKG